MKFLMTILLALSAASPQLGEGVVTGQILNSDATPVVGARVMAMEVGGVAISSFTSLGETDKDGRFRLERLPPGRYYILTGFLDAPTYYPGVLDWMDATVVSVTRGVPTSSVNFRLVKLPGIHVSGHVTVEDRDAEIVDVLLMRGTADPSPLKAKPSRDGSFDFANVPPGNYRAAVRAVSRTTPVVPISVLD